MGCEIRFIGLGGGDEARRKIQYACTTDDPSPAFVATCIPSPNLSNKRPTSPAISNPTVSGKKKHLPATNWIPNANAIANKHSLMNDDMVVGDKRVSACAVDGDEYPEWWEGGS